MAWISEEAQRELDKRRQEQQRVSDMLIKARNTVWPVIKEARQAEIITPEIMNMRFQ